MSQKGRRIAQAVVIRNLTAKGITAFYPQYYSGYCYPMLAVRIVEAWSHPLHPRVLERYRKNTDTFWWQVIASVKNIGSKATLRNWVVRRAKLSFVEALREKGYDATGKWVDKNKSGADLKGTANLILAPAVLKLSNEQLKEQSKLFIQAVEARAITDLKKPNNGLPYRKQIKAMYQRRKKSRWPF